MNTTTDCTIYEIRVERHVGTAVIASFPELTATQNPDTTTSLTGPIPDQAALHGILARVRDLGLVLVAVQRQS